MLRAAFTRVRDNGGLLGMTGGLAGVGFAYAWNSTESWRMAHAIRTGRFRPMEPAAFQKDFCVFDLDEVRSDLADNGMVCLIGLKATGKTTTVKHVLSEATNPFFVEIKHDNVHRAIYHQLRHNIITLPWFADSIRSNYGKDCEEIVTQVFSKVQEMTGKPVHLGFDIDMRPKQDAFGGFPAKDVLTSAAEATGHTLQQVPAGFDPNAFVKDIKYLCADRQVAKVLFSTSEGLQIMAVHEPRLNTFTSGELSMDAAKKYLKHISAGDDYSYSDDLLCQIPRTFEVLKKFARARNKQAFCDMFMKDTQKAIKTSTAQVEDAKELYRKAVQQGIISFDDVTKHCKTEHRFMEVLVKPNIFGPVPGSEWRLQFDCTATAAKEIFGF